jgi:hypothetical protein
MIDLNSGSNRRANEAREVAEAFENAPRKPETRRTYIGASSIGGPCDRKVQYGFMGAAPNPGWKFATRTLRIFARGHRVEEWMAGWFESAGYRLKTLTKDSRQFGFKALDGNFAGHADGVLMEGPGIFGPTLWENKAVGAKAYGYIQDRGVQSAKPEYYAQMQLYMAYLKLADNPALFTAVNMDTMEIHFEFVPFNQAAAQEASDRAVNVYRDTRAGAMRPRCTDDPAFWLCQHCEHSISCWGDKAVFADPAMASAAYDAAIGGK